MIPRTTIRRGTNQQVPADIVQQQRDDVGWTQVRSSEEEGEPVAAPPGVRDGATHAGEGSHRLDGDKREQMIREAAYLRFRARGGEDGHAMEDWLVAEAEIAALFPHAVSEPAFQPERPDDGVLP
jgi:hypothetical protein